MRTLIIIILLIGSTCYSQAQQDTSYFTKKLWKESLLLSPKWVDNVVDSVPSSGFYIDRKHCDQLDTLIKKDYRRLKINELLNYQWVVVSLYFNGRGDVIYCKLRLKQRSFSRQEEEQLREFMTNLFKLKIDMNKVTILPAYQENFTYGRLVFFPQPRQK